MRQADSHLDSFRESFHLENQGMSVSKCLCILFFASDASGALAYTNASSAKSASLVLLCLGKSEVNKLKSIGKRTDH